MTLFNRESTEEEANRLAKDSIKTNGVILSNANNAIFSGSENNLQHLRKYVSDGDNNSHTSWQIARIAEDRRRLFYKQVPHRIFKASTIQKDITSNEDDDDPMMAQFKLQHHLGNKSNTHSLDHSIIVRSQENDEEKEILHEIETVKKEVYIKIYWIYFQNLNLNIYF